MAGKATMVWHKACAIRKRPGARWLHTCRGPVSSYRRTNAHLWRSSLDSAPPSRRCGSLTKSLRMSRRGMGGKRLCKARASRGGAHGRAWVRFFCVTKFLTQDNPKHYGELKKAQITPQLKQLPCKPNLRCRNTIVQSRRTDPKGTRATTSMLPRRAFRRGSR